MTEISTKSTFDLKSGLELFGVIFYVAVFLFSFYSLLIIYWILTSKFCYAMLIYFAFIYYDRKTAYSGGRHWRGISSWRVWKWAAGYFDARLIKTAELDPNRNYIFGMHPHGVLTFAFALSFCTDALDFVKKFPGIRTRPTTLEHLFHVPFQREIFLWMGGCAVTRASMDHLLTKEGNGNAVVVCPGGAKEAIYAVPGTFTVSIKNRKGFVRMALRHGADLVPVIAFGENEVYHRLDQSRHRLLKIFEQILTKIFNILHLSFPIFFGRFGPIPFRHPMTTIVGRPINVDKVDGEPTKNQIDELYAIYSQELVKLYNEHKANYGHEHIPIEIV